MRRDLDRTGRYAAALQCIAQDFRELAGSEAERGPELNRFANLLDHMAASLMVPSTIRPVEIARLPLMRPAIRGESALEH